MHSYRRVAAVVIAAGLLATAGCWNPAPEKYPSILFFGTDYTTITAGSPVTIHWQTRLAEKVKIIGTTASGTTTVATFSSGDTTGCTVTAANSDCVMDGQIQDTPSEDTTYNIEALAGAGNCDRDPVIGNLLHPSECNDLTADPNAALQVIPVAVVPASTMTVTTSTGGQSTTVASGTDVTLDYTVQNEAAFAIGTYDTSTSPPTFTECGPNDEPGDPCNYPAVDANGNIPETGQVTVNAVTQDTIITGMSTNGADDGQGDVAAGDPATTVTITVGAASNPQITAVTIDGNDALGATPAKATADTASLAWTANADATGGTLMSAPASDATTAGDCTTVPAASWTAVTGFDFTTSPFTLTGLTEDMCFQLTATGTGAATDMKTFEVLRQVNIDTVTANGNDVLAATYTIGTDTNPPVITWTTSNAGSYSLSMIAKPAGTACSAADYTGATPVTGTPGNGTYTPAAAIAAATCFQLTVAHPTDNTRTAMVTFEIDP